MSEKPQRMLGVLGGMGPEATTDFLNRVIAATDASRDQEHIPMLVYSDPQTPDRSEAILGVGPSPLPSLQRGIDFLNRADCPVIAIPCNTAHYWHTELQQHSTARVLHIARCAAEELSAMPGIGVVALLATAGTVRSHVYDEPLASAGIGLLDTGGDDPDGPVMRAVREAKAGRMETAKRIVVQEAKSYATRGADAIVVACTDLSAAMAGVDEVHGTPLLDASGCLARAAVEAMAGHDGSRSAAVDRPDGIHA